MFKLIRQPRAQFVVAGSVLTEGRRTARLDGRYGALDDGTVVLKRRLDPPSGASAEEMRGRVLLGKKPSRH